MASRPSLVLAWFVAACIWGSSFLFIAIGLTGLSPGQVTIARLAFGSLALGAWLLVRRIPLPRSRRLWKHFAVLGLLFCALPFTLFAWAETQISSGLAAILNATTPLWTLVLVLLFVPVETITRRKAFGLLVGFAGVVVVALPQALAPALPGVGAADNALGQLACLGATFSYGTGFVWLRRYVLPLGVPPTLIAFGQVVCGLGWSLLAAPVLARGPVDLDLPVVASMLALGVLGTGLAFVLNTAVTVGLGATFASTVTYLSPLIGVLLGALALQETITGNEIVGGVIVVLGVAVGQGVLRLPGRRGGRRPIGSLP